MTVEVMGCPTVCQHCWAMGRGYAAMPLEQISWVLQEVRRFCEATRYGDVHSQRIHPDSFSIRDWWAECAHRAGPAC